MTDERRRSDSGLFAKVMGHIEQARRELAPEAIDAARVPSAPRPAVADAMHIAAALIVHRIRHDNAGDTDEAHIAWVHRVLVEIDRGGK